MKRKNRKTFIFGAAVLCAVWFSGCSSPLEGPSVVKPSAPGAPVLTAGKASFHVQWKETSFAETYQVYLSTDETPAAVPIKTGVTEHSVTLDGLVNETSYYVWVQAVNRMGKSPLSEAASITLGLQAPRPVLKPEIGSSISVSWTADPFADSYNVYYAGSATLPASPYQTGITGTFLTITGLVNNTSYYVWVEAVNSGGTKMSNPVSGLPRPVSEYTVYSEADFTQAIAGINASQTAGYYHITLRVNITGSNVSFLSTSVEKTITIKGDTALRTISNTGTGDLFTVNVGNTLVLDNNLKLNGNDKAYNAVQINNGGTFVMKTGSRIEGAKDSGVRVDAGGIFTMEGGEINGNRASYGGGVYVKNGTFEMSGGKISGNTTNSTASDGGGVYIENGTFIMEGGKISGNTTNSTYSIAYGGGVYVRKGTFEMSSGEISGNTTNSTNSVAYGGGVYVASDSTFTMSGGEISGNTTNSTNNNAYGGGVYVAYDSTFTMSGGAISGNTCSNGNGYDGYGGGVYVTNNGTFEMSGGAISGNTCSNGNGYDGDGGGVYVIFDSTFTMSGGTISENTAPGGGGVYVGHDSTFTMSSGEISGNTANIGGGVYLFGDTSTFKMFDGEISGNTATEKGGGVYVYEATFIKIGGTITNTNTATLGKVAYVYLDSSSYRQRNTAAGPTVNMDSAVNGSAGGWE